MGARARATRAAVGAEAEHGRGMEGAEAQGNGELWRDCD